MGELFVCVDCLKAVEKYCRDNEGKARCEKCAVEKYKKDNPFWNIQILKDRKPLFNITT